MLRSAIGAVLLTFMTVLPGGQGPGAAARHAGTAASNRAGVRAFPAFAMFGWVSPPVDSTTDARVSELAGAGLNLMLPVQGDSGRSADNLARLDFAAAHGVRCLIWDRRFETFRTLEVESLAGGALLDSIVTTYRTHPAFAGYYLGDEPPQTLFSLLGKLHRGLRQRDPDHPAWNNLLASAGIGGWDAWRSYVHAYLDSTGAAVLSYDEYDFTTTGDRGVYVQQLAGAAEVAREYGIPFWVITQVTQHLVYRGLTDGEMMWQLSMALAYGASGIGYFTYWTPAPDPAIGWHFGMIAADGTRTHWYDFLAARNPRVAAAGRQLARFSRLATVQSGSVPIGALAFAPSGWISAVVGRAALGLFADSIGTRYVLIANSDSSAAQSVTLTLPGSTGVSQLSNDGSMWLAVVTLPAAAVPRLTLDLEAGAFTLLRIEGPGEPLRAGAGPALRLAPNPTSEAVRLEFAQVRERGRIEILDAGGRCVWSRDLPRGSSSLRWDGSTDAGARASAGLYFARAADTGGVSVTRLVWLGRR